MSQTYAIIDTITNTVVNTTIWDGEGDWTPGLDLIAVESEAGIGSLYNPETGEFTTPITETPPAPEPRRVSRIDFVRLFTEVEQVRINALRKAVSTMTIEDYETPGLMVYIELVLQQFDLPAEFIELDHPDLYDALQVLAAAGVFGEDPAVISNRINSIIGG